MIEDDPADADLVREAFRDFKTEPRLTVIGDGEKALAHLRDPAKPEPDLILLDLNMPKMDGRQVLKTLKSDRDLKKIPIIILTTSAADSDVLQSYLNGANCFLTKPLGLDDFFRMTKKIESFWLNLARLPAGAAR
jgi:CheY-like chemotaxis protein